MKKLLSSVLSFALVASMMPAMSAKAEPVAFSQILEETYLLTELEAGTLEEETIPEEPESEVSVETEAADPETIETEENESIETEESESVETEEETASETETEEETAEEPESETSVETEAETEEETDVETETETTVETEEETTVETEIETTEETEEETEVVTETLIDPVVAPENKYYIYVPEGYDSEGDVYYPTVYLMPEDGYSCDYIEDGIKDKLDSLIASKSAVPMLVVMPEFKEGTAEEVADDYTEMLPWLIKDVEAKYHAIPDARYRGILGVGVGGYMALSTNFIDNLGLFYCYGSHMGDFISDANPYLEKGDIKTAVSGIKNLNNQYVYIDAPNGSPETTKVGNTAEIGTLLMNKANPWVSYGVADLTKAEYAIVDGNADSAYYLASMERSFNRFSQKFVGHLATATLKLSPQAVTSANDSTTAIVDFAVDAAAASFYTTIPAAEITVEMIDPATGEVLYADSRTLSGLTAGGSVQESFTLSTANKAAGTNTTVALTVDFAGLKQEAASLPLVSVQDTGTADDEMLVDLMGDWYFNAYKKYKRNDTEIVELDDVNNITPEVYEEWDVVQPGLGWWTGDFASSLGGEANYGGYAWYVRTFNVPANFPNEGLILSGGKFDEANEMFINGVRVGSLGMDYTIAEGVGVYDGSNPWDVTSFYELPEGLLKLGETNTIAVRMCNSSGGGGWYEGPIGIYSIAAYNKATGKPSVYADETAATAVKALVQTQSEAIMAGDMEAYAATVAPDFFEAGRTKARNIEETKAFAEQLNVYRTDYPEVSFADVNAGVFVDGDLFVYQATRIVSGSDGERSDVIDTIDVFDYYKVEDGKAIFYGSHSRFFLDSVESKATGATETFRVYLPEGYFDAGNVDRYPTMYLLHGINSQSTTYAIDKVDQILDENIANGTLEPMIVVIPDDPTKTSFWRGIYGDMVANDMLEAVDARYRTVADARYRFTAGCSMGGGGAMALGLFRPNQFSGVISFYGALNYVSAIENAQSLSKDYLDKYSIYMTCGNMDAYKFYDVQEQMARLLTEKGMAESRYTHTVDNGMHDSVFYLPRFVSGIKFTQDNMKLPRIPDGILSGSASAEETAEGLNVSYAVNVSSAIGKVLNTIPASDYTVDTNPAISIPVQVIAMQDGQVVADITTAAETKKAATIQNTLTISGDLDTNYAYDIYVYASILDQTVLIDQVSVKKEHKVHTWAEDYTVDVPATAKKDGSKSIHCTYCDETKDAVVIPAASKIKLAKTAYVYDGKLKMPALTVKDANGKAIAKANYTVKMPTGSYNVGRYTYTITFKGEYAGTVKKSFKINPVGTSLESLKAGKKAITVKWNKQESKMAVSTITGYQIRYSLKKNMSGARTVTVKGYKKASKMIKNLKAGKKYYVQVRTYKTAGKVKLYSKWSAKKTVKTR